VLQGLGWGKRPSIPWGLSGAASTIVIVLSSKVLHTQNPLSEPRFLGFKDFQEFSCTGSPPWLPFALEFFTHKNGGNTMRTQFSVRAVRAENFQPLRPQLARRIIRPLLAAALGLAITLTFSCSGGDESGSSPGGGQGNPGPSVTYEGETYQTVVIGTQTWMARNLNYAVAGSKCYDDDTANCSKYGRLYDWATAMALPACGYGTSCGSQIGAKHKGICPSGWHIPSDAEWSALTSYVGSNAGTKLKATSGWNSYSGVPAGTDSYGFAALPGGYGSSNGYFLNVGYNGFWWSASERGANNAYYRIVDYGNEGVSYSNRNKDYLFSVRCLQD
jgi:uncharacterized protein (TIGR02145 family)